MFGTDVGSLVWSITFYDFNGLFQHEVSHDSLNNYSIKYDMYICGIETIINYCSVLFCSVKSPSIPASILRKSTSGRHRPVSYPDGPMTARYRFT